MDIILMSLDQALALLPLVFGIYLSYQILKVTELNVDGSYVLGAAVFAQYIYFGIVPALSLAILAGVVVGNVVAYMQKDSKVNDLLVGIIVNFMLYSVNLQIMGRPNISVLDKPTMILFLNMDSWTIALVLISFVLAGSLIFFLNSKTGLFLRAFGHNKKLLAMLGKNAEKYRFIGLAISNALAAFAGALYTQINGFADINMGFGVALVGIGAVVIGRHVFMNKNVKFSAGREIFTCFVGIFLYFGILNLLLCFGINPANLKFILGIILFVSLRNIQSFRRLS